MRFVILLSALIVGSRVSEREFSDLESLTIVVSLIGALFWDVVEALAK